MVCVPTPNKQKFISVSQLTSTCEALYNTGHITKEKLSSNFSDH